MTLLKRLQEEARKQARWLHALIELKDVENSLDGITANTVTAVLDDVERDVEDKINSLGNLTESYNEGTYEGLMTTKKIIKSKRTEV